MNEYEHLKKQRDEMLAKHREPGTKCPFGCPHESEASLRSRLTEALALIAKKDEALYVLRKLAGVSAEKGGEPLKRVCEQADKALAAQMTKPGEE